MKNEIWMAILKYIQLPKDLIISMLNMKKQDVTTYIHGKYLFKFIKPNYDNSSWVRELGILNFLGHKHIIRLSRINSTSDDYIYYSKFHYTTIATLDTTNINEQFIIKFCRDIGSAIAYMHRKDIICGAVSLRDIGMTEYESKYKFTLTNLSCAKKIVSTCPIKQSKYDYSCNYVYLVDNPPPEMFENSFRASVKIDMWYFGCTLLYLLCKSTLRDIISYCVQSYQHTICNGDLMKKVIDYAINKITIQEIKNNSDRLALYKLTLYLLLHPNPKDRLSSRGLTIIFDTPDQLVFYDLPYVYRRRMRDLINVSRKCYEIETVMPEHLDVIIDLATFKADHIISKNKGLELEDISVAIDMILDSSDETDTKYLHNFVVVLFVNFAHRTSNLTSDNIWNYMMGCEFIVHNMYGSLEDITPSLKRDIISEILLTLKFILISDLRW